ncbi:Uncharacterised protein [Mycobacteroides abscessus subsp. abscessus]|nr:Uncharacterised protein [Mycobacteroides abscessus subsp. abscessus]
MWLSTVLRASCRFCTLAEVATADSTPAAARATPSIRILPGVDLRNHHQG